MPLQYNLNNSAVGEWSTQLSLQRGPGCSYWGHVISDDLGTIKGDSLYIHEVTLIVQVRLAYGDTGDSISWIRY